MKTSRFINISLLSATVLIAGCARWKADSNTGPNADTLKMQQQAQTKDQPDACSDDVIASLSAATDAITKANASNGDQQLILAAQKACVDLRKKITKGICQAVDNQQNESVQITPETLKEECDLIDKAATASDKVNCPTPTPTTIKTNSEPTSTVTVTPTATTDTKPAVDATTTKAFESKNLSAFTKGLTFTVKSPDVLKQSVLRIGYIQGGFLVDKTEDLDSTTGNCILTDVSSQFDVALDQAFAMTKISSEGNTLKLVSTDAKLNLECTRGSVAFQTPEWTIKELKGVLGQAIEIKAIE